MRANRRPEPTTAAFGISPEIACLQADLAHAGQAPELGCIRTPTASQPIAVSSLPILAAAGEGAFRLDPAGRIVSANAAVQELTGWQAAEVVGRSLHETIHQPQLRQPYPLTAAQCPICLAMPIGAMSRSENECFWRKDGTSFFVDCTSTPLFENGNPAGSVVLFRDITSRKRQQVWEKDKSSILAAVTSHGDLDATLLLIADAFSRFAPGCAIALLTRSETPEGEGRGRAPERGLELAASSGLPASLLQCASGLKTDAALMPAAKPIENQAHEHVHEHAQENARKHAPIESQPSRTRWPASSQCAESVALGREVLVESKQAPPDRNTGETVATRVGAWSEISASGFGLCLAVPLLSHEGSTLGVAAYFGSQADLPDIRLATNGIGELARLAIEHQQLHRQVIRQSHHDHLTGLPNRLLLEDRLERSILHARRYGTQLAVGCIDIDHFKQINDIHGHATGDGVLREVSRLLRESLRDIDTVARQGGDEFLIIMPDLKSEAEADSICERILARLREPIYIGEQVVLLTASLGRTIYPLNLENAADLLQHADIALHAAKGDGRDRMVAFNYALGDRHRRDVELQRELRHALALKQFYLHYQPLYDGSRNLKGFEALLRWTHPRLGEVSPGEFIPLAEKSGLIIPIGGWVLHEACRQAQEWSSLCDSPVKIFVNVSGVQLGQPNFAETISRALASTGLACNLLNLEITETCIVADTQAASSKLRQLRDLGVRISIDDFGCGHSTFSYLQQLPIDTLKIDRSFITCLDGTEKNSAIVRAIVALADELGLETIAEGVETGLQFDALQTTQCDLFQGFLLARPLSAYAARLVVLDHAMDGHPSNDAPSPAEPGASPARQHRAHSLK